MRSFASLVRRGRKARATSFGRQVCRAEPLEARTLLAALSIAAENALPGNPSSEWDVAGAGDSTIQGFTTDISVNQGDTVSFKIDDKARAAYHIDIYRMGYYAGMGARKVATIPSSVTLRQAQPAPLTNTTFGLTDCGNWAVSATWAVPADATSGIYFATPVRDDTGGASRIVFVVRNDASHSNLLFQTADTTWEAYNIYGGTSLYQGSSGTFPDRGVKVSYNRPLTLESQTGGYGTYNSPFHAEYPMVRWLERNGYDLSYFTDVDSDRNGALIKNHKTFLSVGHDEYWSAGQRANVEAARDAGVNLAFFSGNECFWKVRWENSTDGSGTPYRTLVTYKESKAGAKVDPAPVWTGTWRDNRFSPPYDGGRPENALSGTIYMNDRTSTDLGIPLTVSGSFAGLRFWRNTSVASLGPTQTATLGTAIVGYEVDEDLDNGFRPAGLIDMSLTTFSTPSHVITPWGTDVGSGTGNHSLTLYRAPSGALVFGSGTIQWSWGLDGNHIDGTSTPNVALQQATVNLLADMGVQPATLQSGLVAATASTDLTPPTSTITSPANGSVATKGVAVTISGTAADAGGGIVGGVEVSADGGATWHPAVGRGTWNYTWVPTASGIVNIRSRAADDSGRVETPGPGINVTVPFPTPVVALGFEEGSGTTTVDGSGRGNNGTLSNATWITAGKYGKALTFNGTSSWVTVADANSLDASNSLTLEAWVKPAAIGNWSTAVLKEGSGTLAYALYASNNLSRPDTYVHVGAADQGIQGTAALPLNTWSFLASTFDGSTLRLYLNGTLVSSTPVSGSIAATVGALRIGGNSLWGEYFNGTIDEVRVYANILTPTELQRDMNTPIAPSDTVAPTVSVTSPAAGTTVSGVTSVTANAADNVGVAGVQFLLNGANLGAEDTAAPYSVTWDTSTFGNGMYSLTARARDASGNATTSSPISVTVANADTTPPALTSRTPASGATAVALAVQPSATFGEDVQAATIVFELRDPSNALVPASAPSYNAATRTVTLAPSSNLQPSTTYTATVSGAKDDAGNTMAAASWTFTTMAVDTTAPTVTTQSPAAGATNVAFSTTVTATFSEDVQAATVSLVLRDAANAVVGGSVSYNAGTRTATYTPSSALAASATYSATVSGAQDLAGNPMAAPVTWSFTTAAPLTNFTIWSNSTVPAVAAESDTGSVELGLKFRSDVGGFVSGMRFYKGSTNTGAHVGNLWSSTGTLLATAPFSGETASGWQQVSFASPVAVNPNTTYVVSYFAPVGRYAADSGYFSAVGVDTAPLHALANGVDGGNGVYAYGASSLFPASTFQSTNYWVDVLFSTSVTPDTTPPAVTAQTPAPGATGVAVGSAVSATFGEAVQSATIAFVLQGPGGAAVPASLAYNGTTRTATLTPSSALATSTTYTATLSGAQDLAGNTMAAPVTWSFTTAAPTPPGIVVNDVSATEGNSGTKSLSFAVTLSAASTQAVSVNWVTANGSATAGSDYVAASGTLTIPAGSTTGTISVTVLGDTAVEPDETFVVNLSGAVNATITDSQGSGTIANDDGTPGLVLALGFEEGAGTTTADASGVGNNGTLNGAAWTTAGRFGNALSFNGTSNWVTVADAASLDLTNRMTLEAWVRPVALTGATTVMMKERGTTSFSYSLYGSNAAGQPPASHIWRGADVSAAGTSVLPLNTWSHLASTYDGATLRLYVNGTQVGSRSITGKMSVSGVPLRIGGNNVFGQWFAGLIDEVRVYNRALAASEIQADMNAPVLPPPAGAASLASVAAPVSTSTSPSSGGVTGAVLSDQAKSPFDRQRTRPGARGILE